MSRKPIPEFDLNAFSGSFRAESDRACAVLGAALLDARLESLYSRRLRCLQDDLLSPSRGPLGSLSSRIRVARALSWISEDVYFDLEQIRSIRNEFAHNFDHELDFSNQSISSKCRNLRVSKELLDANEYIASTLEKQASETENFEPIIRSNYSATTIRSMGSILHPPRARFEINIEMLAQHLDDLPEDTSEYEGRNLKEELWKLEYQMCLAT